MSFENLEGGNSSVPRSGWSSKALNRKSCPLFAGGFALFSGTPPAPATEAPLMPLTVLNRGILLYELQPQLQTDAPTWSKRKSSFQGFFLNRHKSCKGCRIYWKRKYLYHFERPPIVLSWAALRQYLPHWVHGVSCSCNFLSETK